MILPIEIIQIVVDFLPLKEQINICNLDSNHYKNIKIYKLNASFTDKYGASINDIILKQFKFTYLIELNADNNKKIKNINHLVNLEELDCGDNCAISDENIQHLHKLKKLDMDGNRKIYNIKHLVNLEELDCSRSKITNDNIKGLFKLKKLSVCYNYNIKNISHLTNLEELFSCFSNLPKIYIKELLRSGKLKDCLNKKCIW